MKPTHYLMIHPDGHRFKWRLRNRKGEDVATSGVTYSSAGKALQGFRAIHSAFTGETIDFRTYDVVIDE